MTTEDRGMNKYYVCWNGGAWFVKTAEFFVSQGGLKEEWGKSWRPLRADSIEDARAKAKIVFKGAHHADAQKK